MKTVWGIARYVEHDAHDGNPVWDYAWDIQVVGAVRYLATSPELSLELMLKSANGNLKIIEDIELPFKGSVEGMTARLLRLKWDAGEQWELLYPMSVYEE